MMFSERQIKEKHNLAVLKTFCVRNLGLEYSSPLCLMIDEYRDSMVPEMMSDPETVIMCQRLLAEIRGQKKKWSAFRDQS